MNSREEAAREAVKKVESAIERHNAQGEMLLNHLEQAERELKQAEAWTEILAKREPKPEPEEAPSIFEGARQEYQEPTITNADKMVQLRNHAIEMHDLINRFQRELAKVAQDISQDHAAIVRRMEKDISQNNAATVRRMEKDLSHE